MNTSKQFKKKYEKKYEKGGMSIHGLEKQIGLIVNKTSFQYLDIPQSSFEQNWKIPHPQIESNPLTHPLYTLLSDMYQQDSDKYGIIPDDTKSKKNTYSVEDKTEKESLIKVTGDIEQDSSVVKFPQPDTLPEYMEKCFSSEFYLYQHQEFSGIIEASWFVLHPESSMWSSNTLNSLLKELRMMMGMELSNYYTNQNYRLKGFRRSKMQENLLSDEPLSLECNSYLADFFDINLFVIKNPHYYSLNTIDTNRKSIVLSYTDGKYSGLLCEQGDNRFHDTTTLLELLEKHFKNIATNTTSQGGQANDSILPKASELKKLRIAQLREYANRLEIPTTLEHGKSRLKADILKDLLELIK